MTQEEDIPENSRTTDGTHTMETPVGTTTENGHTTSTTTTPTSSCSTGTSSYLTPTSSGSASAMKPIFGPAVRGGREVHDDGDRSEFENVYMPEVDTAARQNIVLSTELTQPSSHFGGYTTRRWESKDGLSKMDHDVKRQNQMHPVGNLRTTTAAATPNQTMS